jgi:hypothetical protein
MIQVNCRMVSVRHLYKPLREREETRARGRLNDVHYPVASAALACKLKVTSRNNCAAVSLV